MSTEYSEQEVLLREQVDKVRAELAQCEQARDQIDRELEGLLQEGRQYDLLSRICESLDELDSMGAANLFWGEQGASDAAANRLDDVRQKADAFVQRRAAAEERRQALTDKIDNQKLDLDDLLYDVQCAIDQEERRRNNWVVEREVEPQPYRPQIMPWSRGCEEDKRFTQSLGTSVLASLAVGVLISTIALPVLERPKDVKVPERVAKVVREERPAPPPEPVEIPLVEEAPVAEPEPQPQVAETPPKPSEEPVVAAVAPPAETPPAAPEKAKPSGLLAFRDSFANRAKTKPSARLGAGARLSSAGKTAVARPVRSMVSTSAPGSSGGINLSDISRDVGGGGQGIEGVAVSRVASSIGGGDAPDRPLSGGVSAGRTDEEIQIVFDRYKAALYRMYNRELRKNPTLRGQLVLRLTIEPDGSVSLCTLQSSSMGAPALSQRIVDRVQTFDFGAKLDIAAMTIIYPIDFLPAA